MAENDLTSNVFETQLSEIEQQRLTELEVVIDSGLAEFIRVGSALQEIRENRLYRTTHATYADYCFEKWGISGTRAHQLIAASEVVKAIEATSTKKKPGKPKKTQPVVESKREKRGNYEIPTNERQVRPLVNLPPEKQVEAWKEAVETSPTPQPTAKHVAEVAKKYVVHHAGEKVKYQGIIRQVAYVNPDGSLNLRQFTGMRFEAKSVFADGEGGKDMQKEEPEKPVQSKSSSDNLTAADRVFDADLKDFKRRLVEHKRQTISAGRRGLLDDLLDILTGI